jgi:hypothetical protein
LGDQGGGKGRKTLKGAKGQERKALAVKGKCLFCRAKTSEAGREVEVREGAAKPIGC